MKRECRTTERKKERGTHTHNTIQYIYKKDVKIRQTYRQTE